MKAAPACLYTWKLRNLDTIGRTNRCDKHKAQDRL
jgi:hypothetical protein